MTKKDYEKIATVMQNVRADLTATAHHRVCVELARMLSNDNGRFDYVRFIRACEPGANVRARS